MLQECPTHAPNDDGVLDVLVVAIIAGAALRLRWLTPSGAAAAAGIGFAVLHFGGWRPAAALAVFFASGTVLTYVGRARKTQPEHAGGGRSAAQVLGAGGVAGAVSLLWAVGADEGSRHALVSAAFVGALCASAADTWAAEVGMLSARPPRLITTREVVPAGTSGGVTWLGSAAGVCGAILLAVVGAHDAPKLAVAAAVAGIAGMMADSLLGATVQARFRLPDGRLSEDPATGAAPVRGVAWITNPVVNILATLLAAATAAALAWVV